VKDGQILKKAQTPLAVRCEIFGIFYFIKITSPKYTLYPLPPFSMLFWHVTWTLGFAQH
jgi:hypothetical protein